MPKTDISRMTDRARVWIFGSDRPLSPGEQSRVLSEVDRFLDAWQAHRVPVVGGRDLLDDRFLVVAAETDNLPSGCSLDALFRFVGELERALGVSLLQPLVFYRAADDSVRALSRPAFRQLVETGEISGATPVFDTLHETLGEFRNHGLERSAAESWHGQAFPVVSC